MMATTRTSIRFGGILFEVLLSIAIFAGAAMFTLGAMRSAVDAQMRSLAEQQAVDLAASLMAELEIGSLSLTELREGLPREVGSFENYRELMDERLSRGRFGWHVDVATERTEFAGLSLVELTVTQLAPDDDASVASDDSAGVQYTLRQLMRIRDEPAEHYEADEMLDGLPIGNAERRRP